jgi:hypothetical protein
MAKTPEMNADFARWYTESFMEDGEIRAARWKGVVDTATAANWESIEVLVRYAYATAAPANGGKNEKLAEKHASVIATLSGNPTPMNPASSLREVQVLCAAVLVRLFATNPDAAIAVLNASYGGARRVELPMDIAGLAKKALAELSRNKHARREDKDFQIAVPKLEFTVSGEALATFNAEHWQSELEGLREVAMEGIGAVVQSQNSVTAMLRNQIALGEEELQMLWWLIGERSQIADAPFGKIGQALKPLLLAKELGELTQVSPGPRSIAAMFARAGLSEKAINVADAINAANLDWARAITTSIRISPVTTPLHFALEKRVEVGSDEAWMPLWASMTGLPINESMPAIALGEQFYREHLFLHVGG